MAAFSKRTLRDEMRRRLGEIPPERFTREGTAAAELITGHPVWRRYRTVLLFFSMKDEIDTAPLIRAAYTAGKRIFAPRIEGDTLRFLRLSGAGVSWRTGAFGIREPPGDAPGDALAREDFPALIFVPAMAFDLQGRRLGRGKGYYDRFLAGLEARSESPEQPYCAVGFCLAAQVLPALPADPWDKPVNALCTGENCTFIGDDHGTN